MAKQSTTANELGRLVDKLHKEREQHLAEIERIDETFRQFGIEPETTQPSPGRGQKKQGRPRGSKASKASGGQGKSGRRKRQTFEKTGEESILEYVTSAGSSTTAEVNDHWTNEGRGGKADNTLSKLVRDEKLKRENIEGERGSRYTLA